LIRHQSVTDRQTDGRTEIADTALASPGCRTTDLCQGVERCCGQAAVSDCLQGSSQNQSAATTPH